MKKDLLLFSELEEMQIEELLKYSPHYSEIHLANVKNNVRNKINNKTVSYPKGIKFKKAIIAAIASIMLFGSIIVHAGIIDLEGIIQILFGQQSGYIMQYTDALNDSVLYDGLEFRTIAAYMDTDDLTVFYTIKDTIGDRLSGDIEISTGFHLDSDAGESVKYGGKEELLEYNSNTKTATFIKTEMGIQNLYNRNLDLYINQLKLGKEKNSFIDKSIDIYSLLKEYNGSIQLEEEKYFSASGSAVNDINHDSGLMLLQSSELEIYFKNITWTYISNIGFVDGNLHIQTKPLKDTENRITRIYFVDDNNQIIFGDYDKDKVLNVSFGLFENNAGYGEHEEYIFYSINELEQLKGLSLKMETIEYSDIIKNMDLSISFKVPEDMPSIEIPINKEITVYGENINNGHIMISPLYLKICYVTDNPEMFSNISDSIYLTYVNGSILILKSDVSEKSLIYDDSAKSSYNVILRFSNPVIEVENVKSININGQEFLLER